MDALPANWARTKVSPLKGSAVSHTMQPVLGKRIDVETTV